MTAVNSRSQNRRCCCVSYPLLLYQTTHSSEWVQCPCIRMNSLGNSTTLSVCLHTTKDPPRICRERLWSVQDMTFYNPDEIWRWSHRTAPPVPAPLTKSPDLIDGYYNIMGRWNAKDVSLLELVLWHYWVRYWHESCCTGRKRSKLIFCNVLKTGILCHVLFLWQVKFLSSKHCNACVGYLKS